MDDSRKGEMITWRVHAATLPSTAPRFTLDPTKAALMIVDMQNACAHEEMGVANYLRNQYPSVASYYFGQITKVVVPNIKQLLDHFRRHRLRVIFLTFGSHLPDFKDIGATRHETEARIRTQSGVDHNLYHLGSHVHRVRDDLAPEPNELVINKVTRGAFNSTGIDQLLRNMGIEYLLITGAVTHGCVESTARDAADRGYNCVLVADACAGFNEYLQNATLTSFATIFGRVLDTSEVISELSSKGRAPEKTPELPRRSQQTS